MSGVLDEHQQASDRWRAYRARARAVAHVLHAVAVCVRAAHGEQHEGAGPHPHSLAWHAAGSPRPGRRPAPSPIRRVDPARPSVPSCAHLVDLPGCRLRPLPHSNLPESENAAAEAVLVALCMSKSRPAPVPELLWSSSSRRMTGNNAELTESRPNARLGAPPADRSCTSHVSARPTVSACRAAAGSRRQLATRDAHNHAHDTAAGAAALDPSDRLRPRAR